MMFRLLALVSGGYLATRFARPWYANWGATEDERVMRVPGEEYFEHPVISSTHAITIDAPPENVWPWLIQIGADRGGFYSYAWLENLVGCGVTNTECVVPKWQTLKQGDEISLHPKAPALKVTRLIPNQTLALEGWIFFLTALPEGKSRLISRTYRIPPREGAGFSERLATAAMNSCVFELAHFIMGRKQLREIKRLVEEPKKIKITLASHTN